jgi:hypothetical protein
MPLTTYTTYAEVRSALGVSATEVNDTVLAQEQWATLLDEDLYAVAEGLPAYFAVVTAIDPGSRTTRQTRFLNMARLFAATAAAKNMLASLPLFSVTRLADGRAEFERANDAYKDVRDSVLGLYASLKAKLAALYAELNPGSPVFAETAVTMVANIPLGIDPITATS